MPSEPSYTARDGWIAAACQIVGNLERYEFVYTWDGTTQPSRALAISHGFAEFGHDDFNVGRVKAGRLISWGWMDDEFDPSEVPEVAEKLGLPHA